MQTEIKVELGGSYTEEMGCIKLVSRYSLTQFLAD